MVFQFSVRLIFSSQFSELTGQKTGKSHLYVHWKSIISSLKKLQILPSKIVRKEELRPIFPTKCGGLRKFKYVVSSYKYYLGSN